MMTEKRTTRTCETANLSYDRQMKRLTYLATLIAAASAYAYLAAEPTSAPTHEEVIGLTSTGHGQGQNDREATSAGDMRGTLSFTGRLHSGDAGQTTARRFVTVAQPPFTDDVESKSEFDFMSDHDIERVIHLIQLCESIAPPTDDCAAVLREFNEVALVELSLKRGMLMPYTMYIRGGKQGSNSEALYLHRIARESFLERGDKAGYSTAMLAVAAEVDRWGGYGNDAVDAAPLQYEYKAWRTGHYGNDEFVRAFGSRLPQEKCVLALKNTKADENSFKIESRDPLTDRQMEIACSRGVNTGSIFE
jgi:hypothetical protein